MLKTRVAVLVSGGGTNLQALIDNQNEKSNYEIKLVISNNPNAYALTRAEKNKIETVVVKKENLEKDIEEALEKYNIDLIVLAGFMSILSSKFTKKYSGRIINIHPSLIPSFCGKGFYGLHVHEKVLERGVKITGATVHYVNEIPDGGEIIYQKAVRVRKNDTPESLQKRVMEQAEWKLLPKALDKVSRKIIKEGEKNGHLRNK